MGRQKEEIEEVVRVLVLTKGNDPIPLYYPLPTLERAIIAPDAEPDEELLTAECVKAYCHPWKVIEKDIAQFGPDVMGQTLLIAVADVRGYVVQLRPTPAAEQ